MADSTPVLLDKLSRYAPTTPDKWAEHRDEV
jgi:hypothetical protein